MESMCKNESNQAKKESGGQRMSKMRSALIVGATGLVGSELVRLICESKEYVSVTALTRRPLLYSHEKLTTYEVNFDEISERDVQFVDDVFCCLGTTRKKAGSREAFEKVDVEYPLRIAALAKNEGVAHFIVISAMGANEKSFAYYNRVKGKLEQQLEVLDFPRLSIVRPSLLVGKRPELRLGEKSGEVALKIAKPLLVGPLKRYRSIEARQVAEAMLYIALYGQNQKVAIYGSQQLASIKLPVEEQINHCSPFNWRKLKDEEVAPLDEEIIFNKEKLKKFEVDDSSRK